MYKPNKTNNRNVKLTTRACVALPHFPIDWLRRSIETYFLNIVIAFCTFIIEKGNTLDSHGVHSRPFPADYTELTELVILDHTTLRSLSMTIPDIPGTKHKAVISTVCKYCFHEYHICPHTFFFSDAVALL